MFGAPNPFGQQQQQQQSSFVKPTTSTFGQPSAFGQPSTSLFGQTQPSAGVFGQPAPAFGAAATPAFGATATPAFGGAPTTKPSFGFGQPQTNTSLFGQPTNANNSSLFGQPSTSAFGAATKPAFGFGNTSQPPSMFGQPTTSTASAGFGTFGGGSTSAFGQVQPSANGTAIAKYQPHSGTDTLLKNGQTNSVNTRQHCITAMKEYEAKCLEELRMEDYMANRKGPQAGMAPPGMATANTGLFGAPAPSANPFGAATSQPQSTGLFGQAAPPTNTLGGFGSNTFGSPQSSFGSQPSAFGQPQNTNSLFPKPANSFGQPQSSFGQPQQNNGAGGLFGKPFAAPAVTSAPTGFGFGNANNASPFGAKPFGQQAAGGLFGQTPAATAPGFGQQTSFGGFGAPAPPTSQQSLFGGTGTSTGTFFGGITSSAPSTGFGFGAPTNTSAGGGLFGQKPAAGFGATPGFGGATSTANTGFGLGAFGAPAAPSSGFGTFGATNTFSKPAVPSFGGFGATNTAPTLGGGFGLNSGGFAGFGANTTAQQPQPASVPIHQHILSLTTSPYGDNPIFKDLKPGLNEEALKATNPAAQKAILESAQTQYKVSPKVGGTLKVKPVGSALSKKSLFGGLEEFDKSVEDSFSLKPNAKRLVIKPKDSPNTTMNSSRVSLNVSLQQENIPPQGDLPRDEHDAARANTSFIRSDSDSRNVSWLRPNAPRQSDSPANTSISGPSDKGPPDTSINPRRVSWLRSNLDKVPPHHRQLDSPANNTIHDLVTSAKTKGKNSLDKTTPGDSGTDILVSAQKSVRFNPLSANDSLLSTRSFLDDTSADISLIGTDTEPHPTGITMKRSGYYTIPSLDDLKGYIREDGSCIVKEFTIGRTGYGSVYFREQMDVAGLNIDELVHFRHKEIVIYPDDDDKPPIGTELNRKAQVTLDQVWPHDKTLHEPIKDRDRLEAIDFEGKLRAVCDKHDTKFVEYRPETGSWVFRVNHFSKYGLSDSDDDEAPADPKKAKLNIPGGEVIKTTTSAGAIPKQTIVKPTEKSKVPDDVDYEFGSHGLGGIDRSMLNDDSSDQYDMDFSTSIADHHHKKRQPTSPSAHLAMEMGTDSHKLQLMKASFFVDDDDDGKSVISEVFEGRDSPDQIVPSKRAFSAFTSSTQSLISKDVSSTPTSDSIDLPIISQHLPTIREFEIRKLHPLAEAKNVASVAILKPAPLILKPKIAIVRATDISLPLYKSILGSLKSGNFAADLAFYHGRRYKSGWSDRNSLTVLTTVNNCRDLKSECDIGSISCLFNGRTANDNSRMVIANLHIASLSFTKSKNFQKTIEQHLRCQLNHADVKSTDSSDCPHFLPGGGTQAMQEHLEISEDIAHLNTYEKFCESVWSLCVALWGEQDDLEDLAEDSHISIMLRRELFSDWLENVVSERKSNQNSEYVGYLDPILNLLTCHKVTEACELAFKNDNMNLSLLLAQACGGQVVRALTRMQLESWKSIEADKFVDIDYIKALMLVAGVSSFYSTVGDINVYENLDWLKALAINVWYLCSPTASITDSLLRYDEAFASYAVAPQPPYQDEYEIKSKNQIQDIRYHILKLYSKRGHPIETLLNPATHTADLMDFRLSWLLLQVLTGIGYHHCSENSEANLHVSFASQLENYGLWHWSIFVLLHIHNQSQRELAVQKLLYRYIDLSQDEEYKKKELFIINDLGIPEKWIYWAKAVRAGALKKYHAQAEYLLKASQWAKAHEIIMDHIAPDAIINGNSRYIKDLLDSFHDPRQVPNWTNQGSIILDYLDITAKFEMLKSIHQRDIETRWEGLKPQLSELCSRINLFPCPTSKHRLCQSEIAQGLAILVSGMEIISPDMNPCLLVKKALEKLPLPEEYAKRKLQNMLDEYDKFDDMIIG